MKWTHIVWDDSPGGNVQHIEEHDLTTEDVAHVLENYESTSLSHSSGRSCVFGTTLDRRYIIVVYEENDRDTVIPITAYEVPRP